MSTATEKVTAAYDALIRALGEAALEDAAAFERITSYRKAAITAQSRWRDGKSLREPRGATVVEG